VPSYNLALVHAGLGETETALQLLEQAFEERDATCLSCWITSGMDSDRMRILQSSCCRGNHYTHLRHPEHVSFDAPMIALDGISIGVAWLVNSTRERGARSV
jgi:hypothetical protein